MTRHDRAALKLAMEQASKDAKGAEQIRVMQHDDGWQEAAEFAAYHCQRVALGLRPWESPPCGVDEDDPNERDPEAQKLLREMLAAGVSRYEPDPLAALRQAKRKHR